MEYLRTRHLGGYAGVPHRPQDSAFEEGHALAEVALKVGYTLAHVVQSALDTLQAVNDLVRG
ncbi:MAG: hypothetical protein A3F84_05820 [Candidatus Handelsmanbacteria bacterium RIFCSPLOWO2_12_FULL_64_10]|uniref:Uncharacterized protein n=1 Tax=Handelsmanbacteria sp. (strain RIFCSPLOWO2_12_FULL_64_10) TaxID=1817868 RepID=A0A1F6C9J8_HANXR|nr:MAG: hypothetical protein A3F84_05820 [Candidatus Handelsmanbacteria bacterium RIFCSPLOWO2_12_FULL_64_10]